MRASRVVLLVMIGMMTVVVMVMVVGMVIMCYRNSSPDFTCDLEMGKNGSGDGGGVCVGGDGGGVCVGVDDSGDGGGVCVGGDDW